MIPTVVLGEIELQHLGEDSALLLGSCAAQIRMNDRNVEYQWRVYGLGRTFLVLAGTGLPWREGTDNMYSIPI